MPNDPAPTLDLVAIEARANAATPGPWTWTAPGCDHTLADVRGIAGVPLSICMGADPTHDTGYDTPDAEFIAHAREDIPALVARVRALEAENAELTEAVTELEDAHDTSEAMLTRVRAASPDRDAVILADVLRTLRLACGEVGDNDWPDDMHPADVIDKHLLRPVLAQVRALEAELEEARSQRASDRPATNI